MTQIVHVTVSGLTGSGKSAVMGEIEIALRALGLTVEHDAAFQTEKNMTHADWQEALDLYQPTVVLSEVNVSRNPAQALNLLRPQGACVPVAAEGEVATLIDTIRARLVGIDPDSQDLVLEDSDWNLILAALEGST